MEIFIEKSCKGLSYYSFLVLLIKFIPSYVNFSLKVFIFLFFSF
ncbi:MAG: hypothetical protein ACFFG0_38035 [Candidatus Thorarchaeota archaeon]